VLQLEVAGDPGNPPMDDRLLATEMVGNQPDMI
jgi:hypothetical protein